MTDVEASGSSDESEERVGDQFVARVTVARGQADELLRRGEFDFGDHPDIRPNPDGTARLTLFVSRAQVDALRAEGYEVELGQNMSARGRERAAEVGQGDRFEGGRIAPRGLGRKIGGRVGERQPDDRRRDDRGERPS
jgi:hypothetical protein